MTYQKNDKVVMRLAKYGIAAGAAGVILARLCAGKAFLVDFPGKPRLMITLRAEDLGPAEPDAEKSTDASETTPLAA